MVLLFCLVLRLDAGALAEFFEQPDSLSKANVHSIAELYGLETTIKTIVVDNNSCNDEDFNLLDLSPFVNLVHFEVGSFSFAHVDYVIIVTMAGECFVSARLELVSSTKYCLSGLDLPAVKQLVFPRKAFMVSKYAVCESISIRLILPFRYTRTSFNSAWA